jgi:AAA domain-containing protein
MPRDLASFYSIYGPKTVFVPLAHKSKRPTIDNYPNLTLEQTLECDFQKLLREAPGISVLLGPPSNNLSLIDFDQGDLYPSWRALNQWEETRHTRGSQKGRHVWFRMRGEYPALVHHLARSGEPSIGEWRGAQLAKIDGLHDNGVDHYGPIFDRPIQEIAWERIAWQTKFEPPTIPGQDERKLLGKNIQAIVNNGMDFTKNLLGNRWLSQRSGAFLVGPSGVGKSTLVMQAMILWSCGLSAFGIKPVQPLRILQIEAEDDYNDLHEMSWVSRRLTLTTQQRKMIETNTHIEWLNDVGYNEFFTVLDSFLRQFPCDLLIINPYSAYQGSSIQDEEQNNEFLRVKLSALMDKYDFGTLLVHHTPKTNFQKTDNYLWSDWMYRMAGSASITNWARGILVMNTTKLPDIYRFIAAKRFEKIGWTDRETFWSHSCVNGETLWIPATDEQIAQATEAPKGKDGENHILDVLREHDDEFTTAQLCKHMKDKGMGRSTFYRHLNQLKSHKHIHESFSTQNWNISVPLQ